MHDILREIATGSQGRPALRAAGDHRCLLLDLKDDLEEGDDSVAAVVKAISEETTLRNYIGHDLRQKAFGRYSLPQEEEMADAKRPDLRLHAVGIDAPVPVELKVADRWSGTQLLNGWRTS